MTGEKHQLPQFTHVGHLAMRDYFHEWVMSACYILALAAVLTVLWRRKLRPGTTLAAYLMIYGRSPVATPRYVRVENRHYFQPAEPLEGGSALSPDRTRQQRKL